MPPLDMYSPRAKEKEKSTRQNSRRDKLINAEDEALILALAKEKLMAYQIAEKFSITAQRVKDICIAKGVDVLSKDNQKNKRTLQVLELLKQGLTTYEILNKVDCTMEFIAQIRCRNGFSVPPSKAQIIASGKAAEARKLTAEGKTVVQACKAVGISTATYAKYRKVP